MTKSNSGSPNEKLLGDRSQSDAGRIAQIKEVISMTSVLSSFIGNGFGIGIPSRPVHMEISYLEIFHKQGIAEIRQYLVSRRPDKSIFPSIFAIA